MPRRLLYRWTIKGNPVDKQQLTATIEALVFASDRPVTTAMLRKALPEIETDEIKESLLALSVYYQASTRGLELNEVAGGWILRTKSDHREAVARLLARKPMRLSRAALETLAIVAYRQPVTRGGVEDIRGVDSGQVLKTLGDRKLVKILGRSEAVGNPLLYATTPEFLEIFSLRDLNSLPTLKEFQELDDAGRVLLSDEEEGTVRIDAVVEEKTDSAEGEVASPGDQDPSSTESSQGSPVLDSQDSSGVEGDSSAVPHHQDAPKVREA